MSDGKLQGVRTNAGDIEADAVILATGHSARDTYAMLANRGVEMTCKPFAIGARVEHPQSLIDQIQFGAAAGHPALGAAEYFLRCQIDRAVAGPLIKGSALISQLYIYLFIFLFVLEVEGTAAELIEVVTVRLTLDRHDDDEKKQ